MLSVSIAFHSQIFDCALPEPLEARVDVCLPCDLAGMLYTSLGELEPELCVCMSALLVLFGYFGPTAEYILIRTRGGFRCMPLNLAVGERTAESLPATGLIKFH